MERLLEILTRISMGEYKQWLQYTYLTALGYGLHTDSLTDHFDEHAADELDHIKIINRWINDLGGLPPTEVPSLEQYVGPVEGALNWVLELELEAIEDYSYAADIADELDLLGLKHDLVKNLSKEQEHASDIASLIAPDISSDDTTIVIMANAFNKFAKCGGSIFRDYVVDKIIGFYHRADLEFSQTQQALKLSDYLHSMFDEATHAIIGQYGDDTQKILQNLAEDSRKYMISDIEDTVRELWPQRETEEARSALDFYRFVYEWLAASDTIADWNKIYESYNPEWYQYYSEDWQQELEINEPELASEPHKDKRPISEAIEQKLKVIDPDTKKKTLEVGVGDTVYNQTASQVFKQNKEYGINRNQANQYATGIIKDIREDTVLVEVLNAEEPFNEQIWSLDNKLWGSREVGERVVHT